MSASHIRAIEIFIKAVQHGSLRQAAIAQGVSPQAASQALAQLETQLGVRLLHRTTRNIALTDEGLQFLESTRPALLAIERAMQRARTSREEIAGPLRIVAPATSFLPVLWPLVDAFCQLYPQVEPDVTLEDRLGNWVEDRVDAGFRFSRKPEDGMIVRRLFPLQLIACAAPEYLARFGPPNTIDDLARHRCSGFRHGVTGSVMPWFFKVDGKVVDHEVPAHLVTNSAELEVDATLSGQIIGLLTGVAAAKHIRAKRLIPLLTQHVADNIGVYIYWGSRTAMPVRTRAFIDLAIQRLTDSQEFTLTAQELSLAQANGLSSLSQQQK